MNATPNPYQCGFVDDRGEVVELPRDLRVCAIRHGYARAGAWTKHRLEHARCYTSEDARLRWILGMHRRRVQRRPRGIAFGRIVAIEIAVTDCRDRPPAVVVELCIPVDNVRIGCSHR